MPFTTQQVQEFFGVSGAALTQWKSAGAASCYLKQNSWDGNALLRWWLENMHSANTGGMADAKLKLVQAKARREQLKADREVGKLVEVSLVECAAFNSHRQIRDQIQAIPDRVAALVAADPDPFRCKALLQQEFRYILEGLADALKWKEPEPQPDEKATPARKKTSKKAKSTKKRSAKK